MGRQVQGGGLSQPQHREFGGRAVGIPEAIRRVRAYEESGDMSSAVDRGIFQWSSLQELRHDVAEILPGKDDTGQIIFAKVMGTGVADVAAAKLAYDRAKAQGVGMEMHW